MRCGLLRAFVAGLVVVSFVPLAAAATLIVPVSQTRSVTASADAIQGDPAFQSFSAPDFGTFNQTARAISCSVAIPNQCMSTSVKQTSTIEDTRLTSSLVVGANWTPYASGPMSTQSIFDVTFDLTAPASYKLGNGKVTDLLGSGTHTVTLSDESGEVIKKLFSGYYFPTTPPPGGYTDLLGWVSTGSGVLQPGRYRMTAQWDQASPADPGGVNAAAVLLLTAIPEPSTGLLVLGGLLGLAGQRRRSRSPGAQHRSGRVRTA
jgi:hypothetical protein